MAESGVVWEASSGAASAGTSGVTRVHRARTSQYGCARPIFVTPRMQYLGAGQALP